jgi:MFS family permease
VPGPIPFLSMRDSIIKTFRSLKGNERACLWTEPLWGIPNNLYMPFVSVYMAALGVTPFQIGLAASLFIASQTVFAMLSGIICDKMGRRLCTLIFDFVAWSVPTLLWMGAQNYYWFLVAAVFNGTWRVTENSWGLLLIEEAPPDKLIHIYSLAHVAGLLAGFVAPLAFFFVQKYTVVPTMRVLYGLSFALMTLKFVLLYIYTHETAVGKRRMAETKGVSVFARLLDSRLVFRQMLRSRRVMLVIAILACFSVIKGLNENFWPLLVKARLNMADENLSLFATIRSLAMLLFYFTLVPRIDMKRYRKPMLAGIMLMACVQAAMVTLQAGAYAIVAAGVLLEALSLSMLIPLMTTLQMISMDVEERSRMLGFFNAMLLLVTLPFGALGGFLSGINRSFPAALNLLLLALGAALILLLRREEINPGASAVRDWT